MTLRKYTNTQSVFNLSSIEKMPNLIEKADKYLRHKPVKYLRKYGNKYIYEEFKGFKNVGKQAKRDAKIVYLKNSIREVTKLISFYNRQWEKYETLLDKLDKKAQTAWARGNTKKEFEYVGKMDDIDAIIEKENPLKKINDLEDKREALKEKLIRAKNG